jgi:phosphatidylglycerol---prolipoprotein diacylglyceryl transferase
MIPWFDLPAVSLGGFMLDASDALAIAGAVAALALVRRRARRAGLPVRRAVDGVFAIILLGLLVGHTLDVILYRSAEWRADWRLILPWAGGSCSLGVLVGAGLAVGLGFRSPGGGLRWDDLDHAALALLFGLALLRVGCFLGHHHAGRLSGFVLAVAYPGGSRHDLGLDEALLILSILAGTFVVERRWRLRAGLLFGGVALAYAVGRFAIEFLRGDDIELLGRHSDARYAGLTLIQYAMVSLAAVAVWILVLRSRVPAVSSR